MNKILQCFREIIHNLQARSLLKGPPCPSKGGVDTQERKENRVQKKRESPIGKHRQEHNQLASNPLCFPFSASRQVKAGTQPSHTPTQRI